MIDRKEVQLKREDYRAGLIVAMICNVNSGKDAKTIEAHDFFPWLKSDEDFEPKKLSPQELLAKLRMHFRISSNV